jgi:hypothetical protein
MTNGLLGILSVHSYNFLVCITEKQYVAQVEGSIIYKINRIELIPFTEEAAQVSLTNPQLKDYVEGIKRLIATQYFYFSYNMDLTSSRQRAGKMRNESLGGQRSVWETCDKRYFWNYNICQEFFY